MTNDEGSLNWALAGQVLGQRIQERGLSYDQVAALARLSPNTVRGIVKDDPPGRHNVGNLYGLADVLGLPSNYLVRILHGASPEELAAEAQEHSVQQAAIRVWALADPDRSAELLEAVASMTRGANTVLRIARELEGGASPAS